MVLMKVTTTMSSMVKRRLEGEAHSKRKGEDKRFTCSADVPTGTIMGAQEGLRNRLDMGQVLPYGKRLGCSIGLF
jgi:hypothetical protein